MCRDHQQGRLPRPDLTNLEAYLNAGVEHDHDAEEILAIEDYDGLYKAKLARQHLARPMPVDQRLWHAPDVAALERDPNVETEKAKPAPRESRAPEKRRKTGTR
jgi:hypothetical protein